jgi:tRNA pseudouridine65 synthase
MSTTYPEITILYEDEGCIVVAKPPQLLTHGHPRFPHEISLIERIQEQCRRSLYIVHRLDRGASGCLLISKDPTRVQSYKDQLHDGQKTYIALSRGVYRGESPIVVTNPMKVKEIHKEAESYVQCLERIVNPRSSLFLVRPKTGRYHQVRRHLRDLTHPILGDSEHGDSKVNRWWRENMGLKRLALHAYSIRFSDRFVCCPIFPDQQDLFMRISIDNIQDYLN